jgi:hypothetical protein
MPANLTYYIFEGLLVGVSGNRMFHIPALSGGAGGSKRHPITDAVNNAYMEGLKTKGTPSSPGHVHGGPLPPGKYIVHSPAAHPHLGLAARLDHPNFRPMGREGFYIHGRGTHGSDGCIVPLDASKFNDLMAALTLSRGGTLVVQETSDGSRFG